eukprot:COSAG02_NODE_891_length_16139_cov_29.045885_8_plen_99_part_00
MVVALVQREEEEGGCRYPGVRAVHTVHVYQQHDRAGCRYLVQVIVVVQRRTIAVAAGVSFSGLQKVPRGTPAQMTPVARGNRHVAVGAHRMGSTRCSS